jgi:TetR/AcrR family transcriptional regulator, transcriptional repressor for nem operon
LDGVMPKLKADNRTRLLEAAEKVTYRYGFGQTALADIAKEARVPVGVSRFRRLLGELDKADSPKERLCAFVQIKINNREELARSGCPVGTWCSELHKQGGAVAKKSTVLFTEALAWMEAQFKTLGKGADSRGLAVHLLSATQGVSVLAHTFHDPGLIDMEAARLKQWIRSLEQENNETATS